MRRSPAPRLTVIALAAAGLAGGCTGVDPTLGIAASPPAGLAPQSLAVSPAAAAGATTVRFAPVTGGDASASAALADALAGNAAANGLTLAPPGDASARYLVKGYLSAVDDAGKTLVVFVFDVLDGGGNRLHRIQGIEPSPGTGGWAAVRPDTMGRVATRTLGELSAWARGRAG